MKYLIFLILIFSTSIGYSQTLYPRGNPSPSSNGWSKVAYNEADSGLIQNTRDTFPARYPTLIRYLDGNLWQTLGGGARWNPLKGASIQSIYVGYGLTKLNDSTVSVDSSLVSTRLRVQKGIDSLGGIKFNISDTALVGGTNYYNKVTVDGKDALKLSISDTSWVGTGYYNKTYINSRFGNVVNIDTSFVGSSYYNKTASDARFVHLTGNESIAGFKSFTSNIKVISTNATNAYILDGMDYTNTYHIAFLGQTNSNEGYLALSDNIGRVSTLIQGNGFTTISNNSYNAYNVGIGFGTDNASGAKLQVNGGVSASSFIKSGATSSQILVGDGSIATVGNGLALSSAVIGLGGTMTSNANILASGYQLSLDGGSSVTISNNNIPFRTTSYLTATGSESVQLATTGVYGGLHIDIPSGTFTPFSTSKHGAVSGTVYKTSAGTFSGVLPAIFGAVELSGSGNVTTIAAIRAFRPELTSSSTFTGSITNSVGVYIDDINASSIASSLGNKYAIWQVGTTDINLFAGKVMLTGLPVYADNTAAAALPTGQLYRTSTGQLQVKY